MYAGKHEIVLAGRSEAAKMMAAVANAPAESSVTMNSGQFAKLAHLVDYLCEIAHESISGGMGDPRYWVPLEEYVKLKREKQNLAAQCAPLNVQLADWGTL